MTKFENLFGPIKQMGSRGFLFLWLIFFTISFVVLLVDDTQGPARDFCVVSQLLCCSNLVSMGWAISNNIDWTKAHFYTLHLDTFGTLIAFAYFGGFDVIEGPELSVWNGVQMVGTAINALIGVIGLFAVAGDYDGFEKYIKGEEVVV